MSANDTDIDSQKIFGSGLLAALDAPQVGRKFPAGYHEAYWFYGYDAVRATGYYLYLVADTGDETLRHEQIYIYRPDGSILAAHGSGHRTRTSIAAGDRLEFECVEPFQRWQLRYQAAATLIPAQHTLDGENIAVDAIALQISLSFDARTAAWNTEGDWGEAPPNLRYHQLGRVRGTIDWDDQAAAQSIAIDGYCFRSHSRRQRELGGWAGHTLANALFDDGRAFGIFRMRGSVDRPERGRGFVIIDGKLCDADVDAHPQLVAPSGKPEIFQIQLSGEFGAITIHGETIVEVFLSQTEAGRRYGVTYDGAGMVLCDGFARYRWDDRETIGVLERSAQPVALRRLG